MAHPLIRHQLVNYIYNGFLVPVMAPALHKVSGVCMNDKLIRGESIMDDLYGRLLLNVLSVVTSI